MKQFYEWAKWESIMHNVLFVFIIYILYLFIMNKKERTLNNILLFTIILGITTMIHQIINIRNHTTTNYLI
jgi:phosphatidylglycerophosphate synthase